MLHVMILGDRFTHCVCTAVAVCCCKCNNWAYNGPGVDLMHWVWPSVTVTMTVAAKIVWYLMDEKSSSSSVAARVTGTTGRDELMAVAAARRLREKQRQRTPPSTSDAKTHGRQSPAVRERKEILTLPQHYNSQPDATVDTFVPRYTRNGILMMIHCNLWNTRAYY